MTAYYNEWDKGAAAWLRELIKAGLIAPGIVDDRSITDVEPADLKGFRQCHFFAGIGGWSYALRLAGVPDDAQIWTGSPPCQPFSVAGKKLGQRDERHLAPAFLRLVKECRPAALFGEQVAPAIIKNWLDDLFDELEREGYACGAAVLPACSVGAPHKRERLFFGAVNGLDHADGNSYRGAFGSGDGASSSATISDGAAVTESGQPCRAGDHVCGMADADGERLQREWAYGHTQGRERSDIRPAGLCDRARVSGMANADDGGRAALEALRTGRDAVFPGGLDGWPFEDNSLWRDSDWLFCRDGKWRPIEPGVKPLAYGIPARVGRLRGYGNAIVPQVGATFVTSFMEAANDAVF